MRETSNRLDGWYNIFKVRFILKGCFMDSSTLIIISMGLSASYTILTSTYVLLRVMRKEEAASDDEVIDEVEPDSSDGDKLLDSSRPE